MEKKQEKQNNDWRIANIFSRPQGQDRRVRAGSGVAISKAPGAEAEAKKQVE